MIDNSINEVKKHKITNDVHYFVLVISLTQSTVSC